MFGSPSPLHRPRASACRTSRPPRRRLRPRARRALDGHEPARCAPSLSPARGRARRAPGRARARRGGRRRARGGQRDRGISAPYCDVDRARCSACCSAQRPPSCLELDEGQIPERVGAAPLVLVAPRRYCGSSSARARSVRSDQTRTWASDRRRSAAAAHGRRMPRRARRLALRAGRVRVADVEAEEGERGQRARSERVVVEPFGELERRPRVALRPRIPFVRRPTTASRWCNHRLRARRSRPPRAAPPRAARSRVCAPRARPGARAPRRAPARRASSPGARARSREARALSGRQVCARGGDRATLAIVRARRRASARRACSPSSAATIGAPRAIARPAASSSAAATSASGSSAASAR